MGGVELARWSGGIGGFVRGCCFWGGVVLAELGGADFGFGAEHGSLEVGSVFVDDDDCQEGGDDEEGGALEGGHYFEIGGGDFSELGLRADAAFLLGFREAKELPGPEGE